MIDFDQGEFNFDAKGNEDGFRKWREELDAKKLEFERRWGVILNREVCVTLAQHAKPLTGVMEWVQDPKRGMDGPPVFRIGGVRFTPPEIQSIVQVEVPSGGDD